MAIETAFLNVSPILGCSFTPMKIGENEIEFWKWCSPVQSSDLEDDFPPHAAVLHGLECLCFLFEGVAGKRRRLDLALRHQSIAAGTVLFEQGDMPTFQHVVLAGSAHLFGRSHEGREVLIEIVRPGDLVIPGAVVSQAPYLMQARVPEPSRLLLIDGDSLKAAIAEEPALAQAMIASLAGRF